MAKVSVLFIHITITMLTSLVVVTVHSSTNSSNAYDITIHELNSSDAKAKATGTSGSQFTFTVDSPELWTPDSPTLYNITIKMGSDSIESYT